MLGKLFGRVRTGKAADAGAVTPATSRAAQPATRSAESCLEAGNAALHAGDLPAAEAAYRQAVDAEPDHPLARLNLGFVLLEGGRPGPAVAAFAQAIALRRPGDAFLFEAHFLAGRAHHALGQASQALASFREALAIQPAFAEALQAAVDLLLASDRPDEALACAQQALAHGDAPLAHMLAARALHALGRAQEALACLDALLQRTPDDAGVLEARGSLLLDLDRGEEALATYRLQRRASADAPEAFANLSSAYLQLGRPQEALPVTVEGLQRTPGHPDLRYNLGLSQLLLGMLPEGWQGYEARWDSFAFGRREPPGPPGIPRWDGAQPLAGRSILLCAEQGLGDTIQFLRFVPVVAALARQVVLQVQPEVLPLAKSLPANCLVLPLGAPGHATDLQCALMSVPAALRVAQPDLPPPATLSLDPQLGIQWARRLAGIAEPKVGVVWSGNRVHKNDRHRSIPLEVFRRLACDGARFVSLQPELRETDAAALAAWPGLLDWGKELRSFADTAALLQALDLVVTVDTSVAHLAGSLGRPVWILLPFNADWRWRAEGDTTAWYPTARLFRQQSAFDWPSTIERVRGELRTFVHRPPASPPA